MNPGSNLLSEAFGLIGTSIIQYRHFASREVNEIGQWVTTYTEFADVEASVQSVNRSTYVQFGLDLQKEYVAVFACIDVIDLARGLSGDQFKFDGTLYQMESQTTWFVRDGWVEAFAVAVERV